MTKTNNHSPGKVDVENTMKKSGIYIHIPFCVRKCSYCDFLSFSNGTKDKQAAYMEALLKEIDIYGKLQGGMHSDTEVDTVFIGGGTPSILPYEDIKALMDTLRRNFNIEETSEITIEANPGTLTAEKLNAYLECGINRLSIGVQSFDDKMLAGLGRIHTADEAEDTYRLARRCGFRNINLDLMFAIPGHTVEIWRDTLEKAAELSPEHISFYSLQLEENTPFFEMFKRGEIEQIPDDIDRKMYHGAVSFLRSADYHHYEISNAAKPGYECRHNLKYWSMDDYFGFGLGASGFIGGVRYSNLRDPAAYCFFVEEGRLPIEEEHINTPYDNESEYIFTGLRKRSGIDLVDFKERFGKELAENEIVKSYAASGYMEIYEPFGRGQFLRLTEKGIDISNGILADII